MVTYFHLIFIFCREINWSCSRNPLQQCRLLLSNEISWYKSTNESNLFIKRPKLVAIKLLAFTIITKFWFCSCFRKELLLKNVIQSTGINLLSLVWFAISYFRKTSQQRNVSQLLVSHCIETSVECLIKTIFRNPDRSKWTDIYFIFSRWLSKNCMATSTKCLGDNFEILVTDLRC